MDVNEPDTGHKQHFDSMARLDLTNSLLERLCRAVEDLERTMRPENRRVR